MTEQLTKGQKIRATMLAKYGKDYYKRIGKVGGVVQTDKPKGFATMSPERLQEISRKGGLKSRRGKSLKPRAESIDHGIRTTRRKQNY